MSEQTYSGWMSGSLGMGRLEAKVKRSLTPSRISVKKRFLMDLFKSGDIDQKKLREELKCLNT